MQLRHSFQAICASCRIRQYIAIQKLIRCGSPSISATTSKRSFHQTTDLLARQRHSATTSAPRDSKSVRSKQRRSGRPYAIVERANAARTEQDTQSLEQIVLRAREHFGDRLPDGLLSAEEGKVYERLYGRPLKTEEELERDFNEHVAGADENEGAVPGTLEVNLENVDQQEEETTLNDPYEKLRYTRGELPAEAEDDVDDELRNGPDVRAHPLTDLNRFGTSPSTLYLPGEGLVGPLASVLSRTHPKHLRNAAQRVFGGIGLPHSTSTPSLGKVLQQQPIPLDVSQNRMSEIDADVFAAVLMPAMYASVTSVLTETRKRLGTAWAESMVRKAEAGTLQILDAGGAGMGVLAVRDMLRAEWERMKEVEESGTSIATAGGKTGGASASPPLGRATAWITSDELKARAGAVLQDTTILPRMPDYVHTETARYSGKFDIVVAAHTIWPINQEWQRRLHLENLWSLTSANGGVLCIIEKGLARGFECVAEARRFLLRTRVTTPDKDETYVAEQQGEIAWEAPDERKKEPAMIIAPCTNHEECPMYFGDLAKVIKGRSDICHFKQRYIRPPFLQSVLEARDKNHEDVKFSYLSIMRGKDHRSATSAKSEGVMRVVQGGPASDLAGKGYGEWSSDGATPAPSSLSLPRAILPPLKRRGHVILDVCTPAGKLERWTVPRSFSKQAFRDARKSAWGDLWALGAKTRIERDPRVGKHARVVEKPKFVLTKKAQKAKRKLQERKAYKPDKLEYMEII